MNFIKMDKANNIIDLFNSSRDIHTSYEYASVLRYELQKYIDDIDNTILPLLHKNLMRKLLKDVDDG